MVADYQGGEYQGGLKRLALSFAATTTSFVAVGAAMARRGASRLGFTGPRQGRLQALKQSRRGKWLREKADGASFQRAVAHGIVGKGRHEDEGRAMTEAAHMHQQVNAAHGCHLHVRDHARRHVQFGRLKKFVSGAKDVNCVSPRRQEVVRREADGWIIVNDGNDRGD
jgi:hypothetical protein